VCAKTNWIFQQIALIPLPAGVLPVLFRQPKERKKKCVRRENCSAYKQFQIQMHIM
jgi:hypothetical protein